MFYCGARGSIPVVLADICRERAPHCPFFAILPYVQQSPVPSPPDSLSSWKYLGYCGVRLGQQTELIAMQEVPGQVTAR